MWSNPQFPVDLVKFTEEILNGKLHFLCRDKTSSICARQILCLDYSNLEERRNISKLYMIARGHLFPVYGLENECA